MNHIVDSCPLTKFEGVLAILDEAEEDAAIWLNFLATTASVVVLGTVLFVLVSRPLLDGLGRSWSWSCKNSLVYITARLSPIV